ncbi:hypothetical protein AKJ16_DCAP22689 [Drosera capensis]
MGVTLFLPSSARLVILYTVTEEVSAHYVSPSFLRFRTQLHDAPSSSSMITRKAAIEVLNHSTARATNPRTNSSLELSRDGGVDRFRNLNPAGTSRLKGRRVCDHTIDGVDASAAFLWENAATAEPIDASQLRIVISLNNIPVADKLSSGARLLAVADCHGPINLSLAQREARDKLMRSKLKESHGTDL